MNKDASNTATRLVINLTQHHATPEQNCIEPPDKEAVQKLLTFDEIPTAGQMSVRAHKLAVIALDSRATHAMIGGAPYFMPTLDRTLRWCGVKPIYSFTKRESVETPQPDGSVVKTQVFKHIGWVETPNPPPIIPS